MDNNIQALIESAKYAPLNGSDSAMMKMMLENTQKENDKLISEGTLSGDVAQFTPILMPMVRRVYPGLIANYILGVQPMSMPTGYIYALTHQYIGDGNYGASPNANAIIADYTYTQGTATATDLVEGNTITGNSSGAVGTVLYVGSGNNLMDSSTTRVLISVTSGTFTTADTAATVDQPAGTATGATVALTGLYTNEAAFRMILPGYTGSYTTAAAEQLGLDMKQIGFTIAKKTVEAKSRALKGQYTVEMYQDLKAQHGLLADEEMMSLMSYELSAEIDRECVSFVNTNATQLANTTFSAWGTNYNVDGGRWEIERYRAQAIRISREAQLIGLYTKRGQGNVLVVSPRVVTMLEQLGTFAAAPVSGTVSAPISGGLAGTYENRYNVIVDQYAGSDYCTVLYKGADRRDAIGFFSPYVPMSFTKVTNQDSGQPAVIAKTRYALETIPGVASPTSLDRAQSYARSFGIDFTNTVLA